MEYDFSTREIELDRVVLALTLDRKRMTERVIVGRQSEIKRLLSGGDGDVYYDKTLPLGSFLINMPTDKEREWAFHAMTLRESYEKVFPLESRRWKLVNPVSGWLRQKYDSGEPSAMFTAVRTWETYLNCFKLNNGAELLTERLNLLYRPFLIITEQKPWLEADSTDKSHILYNEESQVELWYPVKKRPFEVVVAHSSIMPLISYYLYKLDEWGYNIQECVVCGRFFTAKNRHYKLCSAKCRRVHMSAIKKDYDDKAKNDELEQYYEKAYNYWYTRLRKYKKGKHADPDKEAVIKTAFDAFRKEAVKKKRLVKDAKLRLSAFRDWLFEKSAEADRLIESSDVYKSK